MGQINYNRHVGPAAVNPCETAKARRNVLFVQRRRHPPGERSQSVSKQTTCVACSGLGKHGETGDPRYHNVFVTRDLILDDLQRHHDK